MRGVWRIKHWAWERRQARALRAAEHAVRRFPIVADKRSHRLDGELIVSLTSYPARFPTLANTLRSLLDQKTTPDRTILWLAYGDERTLPTDVLALVSQGLEICECADTRSYKKIIPALRAYPNAFIVTADDDIYYPPDWLGSLVEQFDPADPAILAHRAHMAAMKSDGHLTPYASWELDTQRIHDAPPHQLLFPTGVGGVLYPPRSLGDDALDEALFMQLCPTGDDLWLFWMAERAGTPHRRVPGRMKLVHWHGSQEAGLVHHNLFDSGNDIQIAALEQHLGRLDRSEINTPARRQAS
ncbi:hypothetical protein [Sphingomonas sp. M1A8_2b]